MAIQFQDANGPGELDVAEMLTEEGAEFKGVEHGMVIASKDGRTFQFSLAQWAQANGAKITHIDGFNTPETALHTPPNGMTALDQATFYLDGKDTNVLSQLYPKSETLSDGRVVVMDNDGFWKEMWSSDWTAPPPPPSYQDQVREGQAVDMALAIRLAGVQFLAALAGVKSSQTKQGNFPISMIRDTLQALSDNAPEESKILLGVIAQMTTGLDPFKWRNAMRAPDDTSRWLKEVVKLSSFDFRMSQAKMAEQVMRGLHDSARSDFMKAMQPLKEAPEVKKIRLDMGSVAQEFLQMLVGMDVLKDISRVTGIHDMIRVGEEEGFDPSNLPDMHEFIPPFVKLLKFMIPIAQTPSLGIASGPAGFSAMMAVEVMVDDCLYNLAYVPECASKFKLFMALRKIQASLETKLAYFFQPDPEKNKSGLKQNQFMLAKSSFNTERNAVYDLLQAPKEAWANTFIAYLKAQPNLDRFYDSLPPIFAHLFKNFMAMDAAFDMQPWVDSNHAVRTNDAFSQLHESFGTPPPESGYLAKNSPRAAGTIMQVMAQASGMLHSMSVSEVKHLTRDPVLLANFIKNLQVAAVNREVGTVAVLSQMGLGATDPYASPDPTRIWDDPQVVQQDNMRQVQELMGSMAMEAHQQQQQEEQKAQAQTQQAEVSRDNGQPEMAGAGPNGGAAPAAPMRR
jgi:hypothetical protein